MKLAITGTSGYIGSAFVNECKARGHVAVHLYRPEYENASRLAKTLKEIDPLLVVNAAAYIPAGGVSLCDDNKAETIKANLMLPDMMSRVCADLGIPFAQISTSCLWNDGQTHSENDPPQRAFNGHCGYYVGIKHLAEQAVISNCQKHYIWRIRLPFDEMDHPRNYLSKLSTFTEVFKHNNSLSHRGDFVKACLDLWQTQSEYGIYNISNPGSVKAIELCFSLWLARIIKWQPKFVDGPKCDCTLNVSKLLDAGVKIRPVEEAIQHAITNWRKA